MPYDSLGDFLAALQDTGDVVRITAPVDAAEEIAAITDQVVQSATDAAPALVFANVRNSPIPVVTNVLGSSRRVARALGVERLDALEEKWTIPPTANGAESWWDHLRGAASATARTVFAPKAARQAPVQQVIRLGRDVNLYDIPCPRHGGEANPVCHAALVISADPVSGERFYERVPVQWLDRARLAVHWPIWGTVAQRWPQSAQQWPVAVVLGGDPLHLVAAAARHWPCLPRDFVWDGWLRGRVVETAKCRSHDLEIPAHAEWIIEGFVNPEGITSEASLEEAPAVALPTEFYGRGGQTPVVLVTAITHRANPLWPAMTFGYRPNEVDHMDRAIERLFLPVLRQSVPELVDLWSPVAGPTGSTVFVSLSPNYPGAVQKVIHGIWGSPAGMRAKLIVAVDASVNLCDMAAVWNQVAANVDFSCDVIQSTGSAPLDDAVSTKNHRSCSRLALDATSRSFEHPAPNRVAIADALREAVRSRWIEFGLPARWTEALSPRPNPELSTHSSQP